MSMHSDPTQNQLVAALPKDDRQRWLSQLEPHNIMLIVAVAGAYATLYTVEGVGLWLRKRWAEYLTTIATASLIPFELWELTQGATPIKIGALLVNVAIVAYLVYVLRADRR